MKGDSGLVFGVIYASVRHQKNLARSMFTGNKRAAEGDDIAELVAFAKSLHRNLRVCLNGTNLNIKRLI